MRTMETVLNAASDCQPALLQPVPAPLLDQCVGALLQQAVEKIDRVRECAGAVLHSLLERGSIEAASHYQLLRDALLNRPQRVDWSSPADTFPLFVPLLDCPSFLPALLSGLVVSVGGLTESVVRHSSAALSTYLTAADGAHCDSVAVGLVAVLQRFRGQARVVVPCFKALSMLLDAALLDSVSEPTSFLPQLAERCEREVRGSANIGKLLAAAALLSQLLVFQPAEQQHPPATRRRIATLLLSLLAHHYPKVRKAAAEGIYAALLQHSDDEQLMQSILPADDAAGEWSECVDDLCALLSETVWDGSEVHVRGKVRQIATMLRLTYTIDQARPSAQSKAAGSSSAATDSDALNSDSSQLPDMQYASLVDASGY